MKIRGLFLAVSSLALLAGCSTPSYQGGTTTQFNSITNSAQANPEPVGSPTFRPGLNPQDPRSAQFETRPQPAQPPQP